MSTHSETLGNHLTFCALTPLPAKLKTLVLTGKTYYAREVLQKKTLCPACDLL